MLAWGFSKSCSCGRPGQSNVLKIAQLINHHKMKTNCERLYSKPLLEFFFLSDPIKSP